VAGRLLRSSEGIRIRIIGLVVISIIPILAAFSWQANEARQRSHDDAATDTLRLSRQTAEREAASVQQARLLLSNAVSQGSDAFAQPKTCKSSLSQLKSQLPIVTNVFTVGSDGTVLCSAEPLPSGLYVADRDVVADAASKGTFAAAIEPAGDLVPSAQLLGVLPVPNNENVALVGLTMKLGGSLSSFLSGLGLPAHSEADLLDADSRFVSSAPDARQVGKTVPMSELADQIRSGGVEGSTEAVGPDGIKRLYSYSDVAGTNETAFALVGIPTQAAFAAGNKELRASLIAAALVASLAVALALAIAEFSVSRPVRTIVATVRRLGAGEMTARSKMRRGGELREVADAIDEMAEAVQGREQALKDASHERERLMGELLDAHEDERRKVAADIHDDTIQTMIAAGMEIQLLRVELGDEERTQRFRHVERSIGDAVTSLRNLIFELEPPEGTGEALEDNIEQYLDHALGPTPLVTRVSVSGQLDLAGPQRQVLFRNLREAALNAARHGKAQTLTVSVEVDDGVLVTITDDGRGMRPGDEKKPGHHGLRVMRERAEALGGWFRLDLPGRGTTVSFWLPSGSTA
jgi:signal transduction histidine kinase